MFADQKRMSWVPAKEYLNECPLGDAKAEMFYANRRDSIVSGAVSAEELVKEFFGEHIWAIEEKKPSLWQRIFR
ncbi:MAG: hypothetical protein V4710_06660 [Verrucomicrobiota bacterium]